MSGKRKPKPRDPWAQPVENWTDDELVAVLSERYAVRDLPVCHICGTSMSLHDTRDMIWGCQGYEDTGGEVLKYRAGRSFCDSHYSESRRRDPLLGDERVMELVRRWQLRWFPADVS